MNITELNARAADLVSQLRALTAEIKIEGATIKCLSIYAAATDRSPYFLQAEYDTDTFCEIGGTLGECIDKVIERVPTPEKAAAVRAAKIAALRAEADKLEGKA